METLYSSDDRRLERKSSISQSKNRLSIYRKGEWLPIAFDVLESATCDGVSVHQAVLTDDENDNGYFYPVATCRKIEDKYILFDDKGQKLKELPEYYGDGFYRPFIDQQILVTGDNEGLGSHNIFEIRVGLDYYTCKNRLLAVE